MEVLGKNLYSTPSVAIRELVQNAHDSCLRRQIEDRDDFKAEVAVFVEDEPLRVVIEDTGAGLTRDEIQRYLATVGSGYTRQLRAQNKALIGQFGLGFLSAFIISKRVDVFSTSYKSPGDGWRFSSRSGERYSLHKTEPRPVGTRVELLLDQRFEALVPLIRDGSLLAHYFLLLPLPVFADQARQKKVNQTPPWRSSFDSELRAHKARLDFAQHFEPVFEPICTLEVQGEARGLLWVQDGATFATSDNRNVSVFVRGMLISKDARELLPTWAGFVGAAVESDTLSPTASREDLIKDEVFSKVTTQLHRALVDGLAGLAKHEPALWRRILTRHNEALLGAAISDPELFELLADELRVPTSEGDLTLPALRARAGKIHISIGEKGSYEETLFRALMVPIVNGTRFAALPFCLAFARARGVEVVQLGTEEGNRSLFKPATLELAKKARLQQLLMEEEQALIPSRFLPVELPLILVPDREAELKSRLENDEADRRLGAAVLSLARLYTDQVESRPRKRLYVNLDAPVIKRLLDADEASQTSAAALLKALARLMASHEEDATETDLLRTLKDFSAAVERLLT